MAAGTVELDELAEVEWEYETVWDDLDTRDEYDEPEDEDNDEERDDLRYQMIADR